MDHVLVCLAMRAQKYRKCWKVDYAADRQESHDIMAVVGYDMVLMSTASLGVKHMEAGCLPYQYVPVQNGMYSAQQSESASKTQ